MPEIRLPPKFYPMFKPKPIKVFFGGRGGAKSESFVRVALVQAAKEGRNFLCLREFQNSIEESVHALFEEVINSTGMSHFFSVLSNKIDRLDPNTGETIGAFTRYGQLARNLNSIKSKANFDTAWVEEAETISERSIEVLEPTVLRKPGRELWYSFNPEDEFGPVYKKYVTPHREHINKHGFYEDDLHYICKVGYEDNRFLDEVFLKRQAQMKEDDYKKWLWVYGGEPFGDYSKAIIQPEWVRASIDAHKKVGFGPLGISAIGFDPADEGSDAKAFIERKGSVVTAGEQWHGGDITEAIGKVFDRCYHSNSDYLIYDSIGVGTAVKTAIAMRDPIGRIEMVPFGGADKVDNPGDKYSDKDNENTFKNKRAQYWWFLRDRFEKTWKAVEKGEYFHPDELISLSSDMEDLDTLRAELSRPQRVHRPGSSLIQVESKIEMIKRDVKSPNMADALVYAFANPAPVDHGSIDINFASEW